LEGGKVPRIRIGRVSLKTLKHFVLPKTKQKTTDIQKLVLI